jgi:hypothetical protein
MSAYSGSALVVQWIQIAGTTTLTGDHRNFTFTPSISFVDETAGADAHKQYLSGIKDSNATFEAVLQSGTGAGGTSVFAGTILTEGNLGTLIWSPEGTGATKPKWTWQCYSQGVSFTEPYADVVSVTVNFQGNGIATAGTN